MLHFFRRFFMSEYQCPVCCQEFKSSEEIENHLRRKRKNISHSEYINEWVKESFNHKDAFAFLKTKHINFAKQSLNDKWKRWYTDEEREKRGNAVISFKNKGKIPTTETLKKVSEGVRQAYATGKKQPPMKGKIPHNKGIPCPIEMRKRISETLRRKYASGEILICNNGNNYRYGYRDGIEHFCRSAWEANTARFLIQLKIKYEYEKHRFVLNYDLGQFTYIPDFYLIDYDLFLEVKGRYDELSKLKHKLFREQYKDKKLAILNRAKYLKIERKLCTQIKGWELSGVNKDMKPFLLT